MARAPSQLSVGSRFGSAPAAARPAATGFGWLGLKIRPPEAAVELNGAPVTVTDGAIDIKGALGSRHSVKIVAHGEESTVEVVLSEGGPVPAMVELADAPPDAGAPTAGGWRPPGFTGQPPRGSTPRPKATSVVPAPKPTNVLPKPATQFE